MRRRAFVFGAVAAGTAAAAAAAGVAAWRLWPGRGETVVPLTTGEISPVTTDAIGDQVQTLPRGQTPEFAGRGEIGSLYRYAVEHGDELQYIPCFCGCGRFGHKSNRDCYVKSFNPDGTLTFTSHAAT